MTHISTAVPTTARRSSTSHTREPAPRKNQSHTTRLAASTLPRTDPSRAKKSLYARSNKYMRRRGMGASFSPLPLKDVAGQPAFTHQLGRPQGLLPEIINSLRRRCGRKLFPSWLVAGAGVAPQLTDCLAHSAEHARARETRHTALLAHRGAR